MAGKECEYINVAGRCMENVAGNILGKCVYGGGYVEEGRARMFTIINYLFLLADISIGSSAFLP